MHQQRTQKGYKQNLDMKRRLRSNMTPAEQKLWFHLRLKQWGGLKFRRQHGIGPYIVDFFCPARKLALEVDGDTHATTEQRDSDVQRDAYLAGLGVQVVRYENRDVIYNIEGVLQDLTRKLQE